MATRKKNTARKSAQSVSKAIAAMSDADWAAVDATAMTAASKGGNKKFASARTTKKK